MSGRGSYCSTLGLCHRPGFYATEQVIFEPRRRGLSFTIIAGLVALCLGRIAYRLRLVEPKPCVPLLGCSRSSVIGLANDHTALQRHSYNREPAEELPLVDPPRAGRTWHAHSIVALPGRLARGPQACVECGAVSLRHSSHHVRVQRRVLRREGRQARRSRLPEAVALASQGPGVVSVCEAFVGRLRLMAPGGGLVGGGRGALATEHVCLRM